jgi:alanine racemase
VPASTAPVLVLGNLIDAEELRSCLRWQLMPTLSGMREALLCQNLAATSGRTMPVHLKLDTGMARLGVDWQDGASAWWRPSADLEHLELAGIYSHLANADASPPRMTASPGTQQHRFDTVLGEPAATGSEPGLPTPGQFSSNPAGRAFHYDMVRVGLALYGHSPAVHLAWGEPRSNPPCRCGRGSA